MQRNVLLLAAILATFPFLALLLPATQGYDSNEVRRAVALLLAGGFALVAAAILGATMLTSDAAERRLSFYLARPISATALWFGKIAGVAIVTTAGALIIALPALRHRSRAEFLGGFLIMIFTIIVAHGMAIAIRGGRWRAILDLVLLVVAAGVAYAIGLPFESIQAVLVANVLILPWIGAFIVALIVSGIFHLRFGSWSAVAGHRAWSRAVWSITFGVALIVDITYATYVVSPVPESQVIWCATTNSDWLVSSLQSPARLDCVRFGLLNTRTGRRIRIPMQMSVLSEPVISADQRHAFWTTTRDKVVHLNLSDGRLETLSRANGRIVAVSSDGSLVAVDSEKAVQVIRVASHAAEASLAISGCSKAQFNSSSHLRLWSADWQGLQLSDYDTATRRLTARRVPLPSPTKCASIIVSASGRRAIVHPSAEDHSMLLLDGGGRLLRVLSSHGGWWGFLADDRLLELQDRFWLWSQDGLVVHSFAGERFYGEIAPGILVIRSGNHYALYDVDRGTTQWLNDLRPLDFRVWFQDRNGAGASVFVKNGSDVVRLDPFSGGERLLAQLARDQWAFHWYGRTLIRWYWRFHFLYPHRVPYY